MSSSANLVASITKTKLHENIRAMIASAWLPLIVSSLFYLLFSISNPATIAKNHLILEIPQVFDINPLVILPAWAVLILALLKVEVKFTLVVGIVIALVVGVLLQGYSFFQLIRFAILGFSLEAKSDLS